MLQTKEEIEADMSAVQVKFPALMKLTGSSAVSFFKLLKDMWVLLVQALQSQVDQAITNAQAAQLANQAGSLSWYVKMLKAFQFGDTLSVYDNLTVGYGTVDPAKQIIAQAAVSEQPDGRLLAKVAKLVGTALGPLADDELNAVKEAVRRFKFAGTTVDVISLSADELKLAVTVKYDRQVVNAQGQLLLTPGAARPVDVAIKAYLQALPFDSVLNWNALTDALQKVPGVVDFQITKSYSRPAGTTVWNEFTRETTSRAGHMILSTESVVTYV